LPSSIKAKVDELADAEGISTNAWLMRAVANALDHRRRTAGAAPTPPVPPLPFFGGGPFGPHGVFGPSGVFGPGGPFAGREDRHAGRDRDRAGRTGNVQGWVR
jgi:hypothetical protein